MSGTFKICWNYFITRIKQTSSYEIKFMQTNQTIYSKVKLCWRNVRQRFVFNFCSKHKIYSYLGILRWYLIFHPRVSDVTDCIRYQSSWSLAWYRNSFVNSRDFVTAPVLVEWDSSTNFLVPKIKGQMCNTFYFRVKCAILFTSLVFKTGINYQSTSKVCKARFNSKRPSKAVFLIYDQLQPNCYYQQRHQRQASSRRQKNGNWSFHLRKWWVSSRNCHCR